VLSYWGSAWTASSSRPSLPSQRGYKFNLLADFWPHGAVSEAYGVFLKESGIATRATFVIDSEGTLVAKFVNGPGEARNLADYKKALELVS